jgi:hypothetical protein
MNSKMIFFVMLAAILSLSLGSIGYAGDKVNDKVQKEVGEVVKSGVVEKSAVEESSDSTAFFGADADDFGIFGAPRVFVAPRAPVFNPFFRPVFNPFFRPAFNPFFRPVFRPFGEFDD